MCWARLACMWLCTHTPVARKQVSEGPEQEPPGSEILDPWSTGQAPFSGGPNVELFSVFFSLIFFQTHASWGQEA